MKPTPSPDCVNCGKPHGRALRWIFEFCDACDAKRDKDLLDAAARSITDWKLEAEVHRKRANAAVAEIARLRLTDEEREAVEFAICSLGRDDYLNERHAERLKETLERLKERLQ